MARDRVQSSGAARLSHQCPGLCTGIRTIPGRWNAKDSVHARMPVCRILGSRVRNSTKRFLTDARGAARRARRLDAPYGTVAADEVITVDDDDHFTFNSARMRRQSLTSRVRHTTTCSQLAAPTATRLNGSTRCQRRIIAGRRKRQKDAVQPGDASKGPAKRLRESS